MPMTVTVKTKLISQN